MRNVRMVLVVAVVALAVVGGARLGLHADDRDGKTSEPTVSVQDALLKPFVMPFGGAHDVDRGLSPFADLPEGPSGARPGRARPSGVDARRPRPARGHDSVRLKTGLKLLLDPVGLTYKVVPEDNLLVITDLDGSDDPIDRVLSELKAVHRDIHDLQDAVDEVREQLGLESDGGAKMRKPTIIEEVPDAVEPGKKSRGPGAPALGPGPGSDRRDGTDDGKKRGAAARLGELAERTAHRGAHRAGVGRAVRRWPTAPTRLEGPARGRQIR